MRGSVPAHFGGWLKHRRREAGIGQEELAERLACSASTLQKIETGERRPSRQVALLIAEFFQLPPDEREAFVTFARTSDSENPQPSLNTRDTENTSPMQQEVQEARAPWRVARLKRSNLPLPLTSFIGREREEKAVCDLLVQRNIRLLTLVGAPGIGKTRLSMEVAVRPEVAEQFEDGVFLVELATISDPALVMPSTATTLDLKEMGEQSFEALLLQYVQDKRMLLVLDNFEQVLDAAPGVVALLAKSPWLKVLVTSREPLHVRGERLFHVPPLDLPVHEDTLNVHALSRNPAVALFVERAQDVLPDFEVSQENAEDVATVCIGLDGLPLAIELAAARADMLSPEQLRETLGSRLKLLTLGARDLPARHRTLHAAIEWSYALLGENEQKLFRRMAVFQGGRTLRALEEVCNPDEQLGAEMVDLLEGVEALVRKSLLLPRVGKDGEPRFWMLETIHEYAREKLEESGEAEALGKQHALYFMRLAEGAEPHLRGKEQLKWLNRLEEEHDNMRTALRWAREGEHAEKVEIGLRTAGPLWNFWVTRGHLSEGREWLGGLLGLPGVVGLAGSVGLGRFSGSLDGRTIQAQPQLRAYMARALIGAGTLARRQGDLSTARSFLEESLILMRELGDKKGIALSLNNLGIMAKEQGDLSTARSLFEESLALRRELGDKGGIAFSLNNLGLLAEERGDLSTARSLFEESLTLGRELGDTAGIANELGNLGLVAYKQGDYSTARSLHKKSLALRRALGDKGGIAESLVGLGRVAIGEAVALAEADREGVAWGARILGAVGVEAMLENIGIMLEREDRQLYERAVTSAREQLGEEAFDRVWQEGRAMSIEQAIDYALQGDTAEGQLRDLPPASTHVK